MNITEDLHVDDNVSIGTRQTNSQLKLEVTSLLPQGSPLSPVVGITTPNAEDFLALSCANSSDQSAQISWKQGSLCMGTNAGFDRTTFSEHLRITETGSLGIGTASPAERLHINGSVRGNQNGALRISTGSGHLDIGPQGPDSADFRTDRSRYHFDKELRVDSGRVGSQDEDLKLCTAGITRLTISNDTGKVGIGTENPVEKLEVAGNFKVTGNASGERVLMMEAPSTGDHRGSYSQAQTGLVFRIAANPASGDPIFQIRSSGQSPRFFVEHDGWTGSKDNSAWFGGSRNNFFYSNVGIGTINPGTKLEVMGDIKTNVALISDNTHGVDYAGFSHKNQGTSGSYALLQHKDGETYLNAPAGKNINFRIGNADKMRLLSNGNFGIGTTSPADALDVEGDIRVRGSDIKDAGGTTRIRLSNNGRLDLRDDGGSTSLCIGTGGKVGIGTQSPWAKLEIEGFGYPDSFLFIHSNDNDGGYGDAGLRLMRNGDTKWHFFNDSYGYKHKHNFWEGEHRHTDVLRLRDANYNPVMTFEQGGDVGIDTSTPKYTFHVAGSSYSFNRLGKGSDYGEYFESIDGSEIPKGTSVVLEGPKIRPAKDNEIPIGIISGNPLIAGRIHDEWPKKYLKDEFGSEIMEEYKKEKMVPKKVKIRKERQVVKKMKKREKLSIIEIVKVKRKYLQKVKTETVTREVEEPQFNQVKLYDEKGKKVIGTHQVPIMETYEEEILQLDEKGNPIMVSSGEFKTKQRPKLSPDYDETKEYISREVRPEWNCVGLLGQMPLRKGQPVAPGWIKIKDLSKKVELWLIK